MKLALVGDAVVDTDEKPTFDAFWLIYPRRIAKLDARKAWERLSENDRLDAIVGLVAWRRVWLNRGELEYVMYPATFLNGRRWEDELPEQWARSVSQAHQPFVAQPHGERAPMPQHVKDLLAKLRVKP